MNTTSAKAPAIFDSTGQAWDVMINERFSKSAHIIALRGAGSFNGISISSTHGIICTQLIPRIQDYLEDGDVDLIYDGDNDDPAYPDIGHIMGRLRDHFGDRVGSYAVQVQSWYRYQDQMPALRPLHSVNGREYTTVIFPDHAFPGDHDHFSQNERLCRLPQYEQWYIGACGEIASKQLADYSRKAAGCPERHKALVITAKVSSAQEVRIRSKLASTTDPEKAKRLSDSLERRKANPFGMLCDPDGRFIIKPEYANLDIETVVTVTV